MPQALIALGANEPWLVEATDAFNPSPLVAVLPEFPRLAANLDRAIASLADTPDVRVRACSRWHRTAPAGGPAGQPAFLNGAVWIETTLEPIALLDALQAIERQGGRERLVHWGPRTIDLDLLLYDDLVVSWPRLELPHPRLGYRRFVLEPAAEIASAWRHPLIGWTLGELARRMAAPLNLVAVLGHDRVAISELIHRVLDRVPGDHLRDPLEADRDVANSPNGQLTAPTKQASYVVRETRMSGDAASDASDTEPCPWSPRELEQARRLADAARLAVHGSRPLLCDFWPSSAFDPGSMGSDAVALPTPKLWVGIMGRRAAEHASIDASERGWSAADSNLEDERWRRRLARPGRGPWLLLEAAALERAVEELVGAIESFCGCG